MRRIAIDVRAALAPEPAGKGQWVRGFVSELVRRDCPLLLLSHGPALPEAWERPHVRCWAAPGGTLWHVRAAQHLRDESPPPLSFSPLSFIVPALIGKTVPSVPLVHDLIAFRGEPHDRKATLVERLTLGRALRQARHVCAISASTKKDLLVRFPFLRQEEISVLFAGPLRQEPPSARADEKVILSVGTLCPRKNQLRLIRAYALLPEDLRRTYTLVLAGGRGWQDEAIVHAARSTPGVQWRGYVPDSEYERLLTHATLLAFPSLYEGFGMPVLDALQRGLPVLTSRRGSLGEVAGQAAVYVEPEDERSLAAGLEKLLRDRMLRERLRSAGPLQAAQFSWKKTVNLFLAAVQPLL
ncbi:MAG: glycosyltransferase family 1 protein [Candidatus Peribacteraceae bacterium]|nr:glycosyltransferase family 1 protein [Candidatus Peribacteraceae bacterium]